MVKRAIFDNILEWLNSNKIIILKGARQVGKTTLLLFLRDYLQAAGKHTVYISADDLMYKNIFDTPTRFFQYLKFEHNLQDNGYIFIDEFQYIKEAGIFVKVLYDTAKREGKNFTFIVSGSSSLEISKNKEFLTGRKVEFTLSPLSFKEILVKSKEEKFAVNFNVDSDFSDMKDFYQIYKDELEGEFVQFLRWGGYPEVYLTADIPKKRVIFKDIITSYLEKDIAGFLRIANISAFNHLIKVLTGQIGNLVNKNELSGTLGLNYKTVEHYLDVLEGTYVFSYVPPYFTNTRKELTQMPKVFIHDPGVYYYYYGMDITFGTVEGKVIENSVFNMLNMAYPGDIYFYRTKDKAEVDFVVKGERQAIPVEVKFRKDITVPASVKNFMSQYNVGRAFIITKDYMEKKEGIFFIPVVMLPFCRFTGSF